MGGQGTKNESAELAKTAVFAAAALSMKSSAVKALTPEWLPGDEKREFSRIKFINPVIVKIGGTNFDAMAYNISQGGMCFISPKTLKKGKKCIIRNDQFTIFKDGIIVSVGAPDTKGLIRYGVQFSPKYSSPEFSELIKKISDDERKIHIYNVPE